MSVTKRPGNAQEDMISKYLASHFSETGFTAS